MRLQKKAIVRAETVVVACLVILGAALPVSAGGLSSSVQKQTMSPNETHFFPLGELSPGEVAFGITTPVAGLPGNFDTPDTELATFFEDDVGPGDILFFILTYNDDSLADTNTVAGDSFGSLFRLESPVQDRFTVGVTGFADTFENVGHGEQGDYLLTLGHVDPSSLGGDFPDNDTANDTLAGADLLTRIIHKRCGVRGVV